MVDYSYYLLIGAVLFVLGLVGFITRRNLIMIFLCTELMLQGVILNLVGFNRYWLLNNAAGLQGQAFSIFLMVVAAAEAALAMALVMVLQRRRDTLDAGAFAQMKG